MRESLGSVTALAGNGSVDVLAVGKAAAGMLAGFESATPRTARHVVVITVRGTRRGGPGVDWREAGHPVPDERSVAAGRHALALARNCGRNDTLVVLLSGGASALMVVPAEGVTLDDKRVVVHRLLESGADIRELNTVRKHLSDIKGGQLAAACAGTTVTLAISDVVGDQLPTIGSGPTVADPTTWQMALDVLAARGGDEVYPSRVVTRLRRGANGMVADTPKPGDPRLSRSTASVIGSAATALEGARRAAESRGYHVEQLPEPVIGEARLAALHHLAAIERFASIGGRPVCLLSAGETTVHVRGGGRGGRNQEFALALVEPLAGFPKPVAAASVGTDGVDGPTDAAGAVADTDTLARARLAGLAPPARYLDDNNAYAFFDLLGDLMRPGPTGTNVGDIQVVLIGPQATTNH